MHTHQNKYAAAFSIILAILAAEQAIAGGNASSQDEQARAILSETGVSGGLIVHLGCGDGKLTAALREGKQYVVHGLDTDADTVAQARAHIRSLGVYGKVSVDQFNGRRLPYTDNLVNLIVSEDSVDVPRDELMRVLAPGGVAYLGQSGQWAKITKPWPGDIDQWTHYLHGADGNAVAADSLVGPPQHYQWMSGPLWLRSHESDSSIRALVTAEGRLFYIVDEGPTSLLGDHSLPDKWFLAARDAFNGVRLWKVPIQDWGWRAWKPSWFTCRPGDIPLNIQKRLVAVGDKVYATLGYRAPLSQLDARTGEVLQTYDNTDRTAEILHHEGKLILTVLRGDRAVVMAVDAATGKQLWTSEKDYAGTTTDYYRFRAMHGSVPPAKVDPTLNTATDGTVVALVDVGDVVCLDTRTGKEKWRTVFPLVQADYRAGNIDAQKTLWRGTMIVRDGVVIHASPNQLAAFSAATGEILWKQPKKYLQHLWFEWMDVFVIDGLVWTWSAELERGKLETSGRQRGGMSTWPASANGYDLQTGELKQRVPLGNIFKTHHHHRCYRNKATIRYILASRRGTEFVDLKQGKHTVHNWVRGTCHLGMMPANGLQYAPPHPCQCYIDEKLKGFNALAASRIEQPGSQTTTTRTRLERGPAYNKQETGNTERGREDPAAAPNEIPHSAFRTPHSEDWPTFRHDGSRSGSVHTKVPAEPQLIWRKTLGGKLAAPAIVRGTVFLPLVDAHHLIALDTADAKPLWEHAAGGRIDTPPTYFQGTVIFGSADGCVYCVRAADGARVWRFRAAPEDRRIGVFGQLESAWPVHGSVLVLDGIAYFAAGRSSQLDGGIYLFGVDAASGKVRHEARLEGPHYGVDDISQNYLLPMGALADMLQSDGERIYMRDMAFDNSLQQQKGPPSATNPPISAPGGLLDDSYFKRIPWKLGGLGGYARLIVHDDQAAYLVRMFDSLRGLDPSVYFTPGKQGYLLLAVDKKTRKQTWDRRINVRINTMVATDGPLFVAGYPDVVDPEDPLGAFEGRKGGVLAAVDRSNGETLWETNLPAPPVYNGMAAASGRLYIALQDGSVACFGG